jgi:hypothetical protein
MIEEGLSREIIDGLAKRASDEGWIEKADVIRDDQEPLGEILKSLALLHPKGAGDLGDQFRKRMADPIPGCHSARESIPNLMSASVCTSLRRQLDLEKRRFLSRILLGIGHPYRNPEEIGGAGYLVIDDPATAADQRSHEEKNSESKTTDHLRFIAEDAPLVNVFETSQP